MAGLGSSMQSLRTAWYADVLYSQELYRLNCFPYFKPHIPSLDSQASTSFSFPGYFLVNFDPFFKHRNDNGEIGASRRVYTLRRTKGNIRSTTHGYNAANSLSSSQWESHLTDNLTCSPPHQSESRRLSTILEQGDPPDPITSPSNSTDSLMNSADSAIHFFDGGSGATFSYIQQASGARISAEQFELERSSLRSSLSLHIGSPPPCSAADLDLHIESLPSFVLTLPTPASPHSPIFSPGVPFTTEKFLDAAEAAAPKDRAPTLPQCDHGQAGKLCRACEMQLLACRVWFQNTDGGARAALHEPFVRPAQSTVRTRAVLASLGVGETCPSGVGLGLANGCDEGDSTRDGDGDVDDPGSLAIEAPPVASSRRVPLNQAISWSKGVLSKLRIRLRKLSLPLPTTSLNNGSRKRRRA
jgi:hypothetical protein